MTTFEEDFAELIHDTIRISPLTGRDKYGQPVYGSPVERLGRLVRTTKLVRSNDGSLVASSQQLTLGNVPGLTVESSIELPDGSRPTILSVEQYPDENGNLYTMKVLFQ